MLILSVLHAEHDRDHHRHPSRLGIDDSRHASRWASEHHRHNSNLPRNDEEEFNEDRASDIHGPYMRECLPEEVIKRLQAHIRQEGTLSNLHRSKDHCIQSYFTERAAHPHGRGSVHPRHRRRVRSPDSEPYREGYNHRHGDGEDMVCKYPSRKDHNGRCTSPPDRNSDENSSYRPPHDNDAPPTISYSMRDILNKVQDKYESLPQTVLNNVKNKFMGPKSPQSQYDAEPDMQNTSGSNNFNSYPNNGSGYPSDRYEDTASGPMYCSLRSNKIVPYIVSYGPPDEKKMRKFSNFPKQGVPSEDKNSNNPLKKLNVTDTILVSPLTLSALSDMVTQAQRETTSTQITHISISDIPIIRVSEEHLLHPMCTEGTLCLLDNKCMYTSSEQCESKNICAPPTVKSFIKSIPHSGRYEKTPLIVYNAQKQEFSIEKIFVRNQKVIPHNIEYTSIETSLLENSPVSESTIKTIQSAIMEAQGYSRGRERPPQNIFLIESNNTRGFIIFLIIKQILEDSEHHQISEQVKAQMRDVYMQIFRNEIRVDQVSNVVMKDIDMVISVLNTANPTQGQYFNRDRYNPNPPYSGHSGDYPQNNDPNRPSHGGYYPNGSQMQNSPGRNDYNQDSGPHEYNRNQYYDIHRNNSANNGYNPNNDYRNNQESPNSYRPAGDYNQNNNYSPNNYNHNGYNR
ncbi:hypothetical protein NEAUS05_0684 [Nematocida ausubeli]|nr:hypothetical protein NEAUS05_0684 [Nematocida ausubeli]